MLPKLNRLRKSADIIRVLKNGKFQNHHGLTLKWLSNQIKFSRFTFIVSKKVDNRAVIRNRLRRILREQIRLNCQRIKPGFDIIIITKPQIINYKNKQIRIALDNLLEKTGLINDK